MPHVFTASTTRSQVTNSSGAPLPTGNETLWVDINDTEEDAYAILRDVYQCHPLILDHIQNGVDRPRVSTYESWNHLVFSAVTVPSAEQPLDFLHIVFGEKIVVTVHHGSLLAIPALKARLQCEGGATLLSQGAGFFVYTLLDEVTDERLVHLDCLQDDIDDIEDKILLSPDYRLHEAILSMRRKLQRERRLASAEREAVNSMLRPEFPYVGRDIERYVLDLYYHTSRVLEVTDTEREHLMALAEMLMAATAQRTNDTVKLLTVVSTIFMPLTLITGIYGMNFVFMPELKWPGGYPLVIAVMGVIVVGMLAYFRKREWI